MNPSTKKTVADRAVLCQRGNELAEFASLLTDLGLSVDVHTGDLPTADELAGACLVIVAGQRLTEGRPFPVRSWPRTLAVVDDGSKTLAAHLHRIGVAMIIRRPIHPRALRLLLIHELYRGPERRGKKRVLIGHPIRAGGGLFKQSATLLELSRTGARIALSSPPKIGSLIQFVLGKELTNAKPITVQARVVRAIGPTSGARAGESEVGVALLDPIGLAKPIQAILDRFALGPATTGSGLRPNSTPPAARGAAPASTARPATASPATAFVKSAPAPATSLPTARSSSAADATPSAPSEPRRLPPSYQPGTTSEPIACPPVAPEPVLTEPCPDPETACLPLDAADTEIEVLETDFDLELELDDELDDAAEPESTLGEDPLQKSEAERRRSVRVPYDQRVVALDAQAARVVVGRDLCLGGMRIAANPELAVGDVLRLALHAGTETQPLIVLAGVERDDGVDGLVLAFAALTVPQRERLEKILALSGAIQGPAEDAGGAGDEGESLVVGELLARVARGRDALPSRAGFTLIELMIVVSIIGSLSSIAMPLFGRQ